MLNLQQSPGFALATLADPAPLPVVKFHINRGRVMSLRETHEPVVRFSGVRRRRIAAAEGTEEERRQVSGQLFYAIVSSSGIPYQYSLRLGKWHSI